MCTWEDLGLSMVLPPGLFNHQRRTEFSFKPSGTFSRTQWFLSPSVCLFSTGPSSSRHHGHPAASRVQSGGHRRFTNALRCVWTLGLIGWTNYGPMTVIIVGPILLLWACRTVCTSPTDTLKKRGPKTKMRGRSRPQGKRFSFLRSHCDVLICRFHAHGTDSNGWDCACSIVIVYFLTMSWSQTSTILDLRPSTTALPSTSRRCARRPAGCWCSSCSSSSCRHHRSSQRRGKHDLLGMAPETESPVVKMKQYSAEAGQVGMILVNANVSGDFNDADESNDDLVDILQKINNLEAQLNPWKTQRLSVVFLMIIGVQVTVSGEGINELSTHPRFKRAV